MIRLPGMLMEKLSYLASTIAIADFRPADQYAEVYEKLHAEWLEVQQAWQTVKENELAAMRAKLIDNRIGPLNVSAN